MPRKQKEFAQTPSKLKKQRLVPMDLVERKGYLTQAVKEEKPIREIAQAWGVSPNEICCYIRAYGLKTKKAEKLQTQSTDSVPPAEHLEQELIDLYVNQSLSTVDIGNLWKIHSNAIIFFLRAFNIPIRAKGKLSLLDRAKYQQTFETLKNDLYRMYIEENKSTSEIALALNLKPPTILKYLRTLGINHKNVGKRFSNHKHTMPMALEEIETELKRLYVDEQMSLLEIANNWGVDFSTISKNLKRFGIATRKSGRKNCVSKKLLKKGIVRSVPELKTLLIELYQKQGLSIYEISHRWDISSTTVLNYLKRFEIPRTSNMKSPVVSAPSIPFTPKWDKKDSEKLKGQLNVFYVEQKRSFTEIAAIFDVSVPTVKKYLAKFDLLKTTKPKARD